MGTKLPNSFRRAVRAFCFIFGIVFLAVFVSDYLGYYGFSLDPIVHEQGKLCSLIYHDAIGALGAGLGAAAIVYLGGRNGVSPLA
jgi:hypothetical protein